LVLWPDFWFFVAQSLPLSNGLACGASEDVQFLADRAILRVLPGFNFWVLKDAVQLKNQP